MNKEVLYIDVDDDITAIIGKIKDAKEKIVALVPPKRVGALQSAVNLRLLERMAKKSNKQLVLITGNQALMALAANANIPVAKNLQSKPELAEIPALIVDDGDDIINGADLPVGDHAKTAKNAEDFPTSKTDAIDTADLDIDGTSASVPLVSNKVVKAKKPSNGKKIPNFDTFRKKLILIIGGSVAVIGLLIWMFIFAPSATVEITARTSPSPISASVKLGGTAATDFKTGVISSVAQQEKKELSVEFDATGEKDIGDKATGTIKISKLTQTDVTVPAGSRFSTASGLVFVTQAAATIGESQPCFPTYCAQSATVAVTASASGPSYNGASGSVSGAGGVNGSFQGTTSGGTSKIAKVVSADDVERARGQLMGQSTDEDKKALIKKFTNGEIIIDSSFVIERSDAVSTPAVDQEAASGKAKLVMPVTLAIQAVAKPELEKFLKSSLESKIDAEKQKVYDSGVDKASLVNFQKEGEAMSATLNASGRIGPVIDEAKIKEDVKGKIYGEVQQNLESVEGVQSVDVKFSYFWVRTVPDDVKKIKIEFKVENE